MVADDEIWRPDYDGPPPTPGPTSLDGVVPPGRAGPSDVGADDRVRTPPPAQNRASRANLIAVVVALTVIAGVVVTAQRSSVDFEAVLRDTATDASAGSAETSPEELRDEPLDEPLDPLAEVDRLFAGADSRRLPTSIEPSWSVDLPRRAADGGASALTWAEVVDDRYVLVGVGDGRLPEGPAIVHGLDATTGAGLWSTEIATRVSNVTVVATIDDIVVLSTGSEIVTLDLADGSELWGRGLIGPDGDRQSVVLLGGTDVLAVSNSGSDAPTRLISASTGAEFRQVFGEIIGTDRQGRWYERRGGKLFESDLRDQDEGPGALFAEPELVATFDSSLGQFVAIIDDFLVTTADGRLATGPVVARGERAVGPGGLTPVEAEADPAGSFPAVQGVTPLGGSAFAVFGGGTVTGAEVTTDGVRFAWQRRGVIMDTFSTDRGTLLLLGTDGGAAQTLIDGATAETIASFTMAPGLFDSLEVVGNGVVTRRTPPEGPRIAALDLDGNEMWALEGSTPVAIGRGVVVRSTTRPDGSFAVTAYGSFG